MIKKIKNYILSFNSIKNYILMDASFWYVETEWEKSWEMDYIRSARQFIKNRFYTEYQICSVFDKEPYKLQQAVDLFMIQYRKNNLLEGRTALISNKERSVFVDDEDESVQDKRDRKLEQLLRSKKNKFGW